MKKKILFFVISISLLLFIVYGLRYVYSTEAPVTPKEVKPIKEIKPENKIGIAHTEIFEELERPQVIFDHDKHVKALKEQGCETCHPLDKEKGLILFEFPKKVEKKDG
ncbi:MAG: cytochrome c3 family protein, partial [Nitrospirota bacterium]